MHNTASESLTLRARAEQIADSYEQGIGAPSKLGETDTVHLLLAAITDGLPRERAATAAGISKVTLYNWMKRAEAGEHSAILFVNALEKAESEVERRAARNVLKASEQPQFWAAGMTYLERRWPDRWGKRQDDGNTPKVIVQLGVSGERVQVNVVSQSLSPSLSEDLHSLTPSTDSGLVNIMPLIGAEGKAGAEPLEAVAAPDQPGDPTGGGMAPSSPRGAERVKGVRGGRKKKA